MLNTTLLSCLSGYLAFFLGQIPVFEIKPNGFGGAKKQCRVSAADSLYFIDGLNGFLNLFLGCLVMLETGDPKLGTSVQKLSSISTNPSAESAFSSLIIAGCSVIVSVMAEESVADDDDDMSSLELSGLFEWGEIWRWRKREMYGVFILMTNTPRFKGVALLDPTPQFSMPGLARNFQEIGYYYIT
nr:hypothetical protein Iba_chr12dCG2710 [Ipomoea batatas]